MTTKRKLEVENAFANDWWTCTTCALCLIYPVVVVVAAYYGPWDAE
jgi:hypothetical protein